MRHRRRMKRHLGPGTQPVRTTALNGQVQGGPVNAGLDWSAIGVPDILRPMPANENRSVQARRRYACPEIDHAELIERLETYDAWALSLSSTSLPEVLPLCPEGVRVGAWVKPFCSFRPNVNP